MDKENQKVRYTAMGQISIDQSHAVMATLAQNADWRAIDFEKTGLQDAVLRDPTGAGRRFTAFLQSGCRMVVGDLKIATVSFDPVSFIGKGWKIIPEEQDERSASLQEVDFGQAQFLTCLKGGEKSITGEEKLARLKKGGCIRHGATVFMGLWQDYQARKKNSVLERLYHEKGITYLDFFGDILQDPDGRRRVLSLSRGADGAWDWLYRWLKRTWCASSLSSSS